MAGKDFSLIFNIGGKLNSSFSGALGSVKSKLEGIEKTSKSVGKGLMAVSGAAITGLGIAANEAIKFESAFADVKKVVDGTPEELKAISDAALEMSTRLPMAADEITKIMAAGGQSGIAKNELGKFTEDAIKMGIAFDIGADEAGQAMAELRTAFKMNQKEVVVLADKINYLGNTTPATAKGITEIVQRIGPLGEVGGFAAGSIAALGATIRGMGVQEEIAATGIKNMMLALVAGESATKSQKAAYKALGLDSGKIAKSMQKDAEGTTLTVLKQISKLDKYKQAATLKELFGSESLGAIAPLLTNMGALEKNLKAVGDATVYAGSMEKEYAARAATTENAIKLAKNQINVLAITIGTALLPTINKMLESFGKITERVYQWTKANPELTSSLSKIAAVTAITVGGLGALSVGIWALAAPFGIAIKLMTGTFGVVMRLFSGLRYLSTALPFLITIVKWMATGLWVRAASLIGLVAKAVLFLGRVFLMNPIGLAITAIIGVIYLLYKNWDTVKSALATGMEYVKVAWTASLSGISSVVSSVWTSISGFFTSGIANISATIVNWSPLGLFYRAFAAVLSWFGVDLPSKFTDFGKMIIQGLINGITNMASQAVETAKAVASSVASSVKGFFGIHSPSRLFTQFGEYNMMGLANGMQNQASITANTAQSAVSGTLPSVSQASLSSALPSARTGSTLNLTQQITVSGSSTPEQAKELANQSFKQFENQFNAMMSKRQRVAY